MPSSPDILIIGAGLIGLSCADSLAAKGANVTVLDQREGPVRGTSFSNSGMIHPSQSQGWMPDIPPDPSAAKAVLDLAMDSRTRITDNMARLGLMDMQAREAGCVQIFDDLETARRRAEDFEELGVRAEVMIDPVKTLTKPGLYFPDDRSGDARGYGEALAADLSARGVIFHYNVRGVKLRRQNDEIALVVGRKRYAADHVILATGAQTAELLRPLGLSIDIQPVMGFALNYARPDIDGLPSIPIMDARSRSALSIFGDVLRISGGWDLRDPAPMLARWAEICPHIMAALGEPLSEWKAARPISLSGRPFISATSIPGLWVNAGHGHMGWTLCAGSGALMADMIMDGAQDNRFVFRG